MTHHASGHPAVRRASHRAAAAAVLAAFILIAAGDPIDAGPTPAQTPPQLTIKHGKGAGVGVLACDDEDVVYTASGIDLLGCMSVNAISSASTSGSDIWGYASPSGREYALMGVELGFGFVEVTDPTSPSLVGFIPSPASIWHDIKVLGPYAYAVNDVPDGVGLQVIDLTEIDNATVTLAATMNEMGLETAHNIALNPQSGFAYLCGANLFNGGLIAVDLSNPIEPHIAGSWDDVNIHDALAVTYEEGPNAGREIVFAAAGSEGLKIIDATDKDNLTALSTLIYPHQTFTHSFALTSDLRYLFISDEVDEIGNPGIETTTTYVVDVADPDNPRFLTSFTNGLSSIDHNLVTRGHLLFEANYRSGLRVFDVRDILNVREVGFFDTYPENDDLEFEGSWGVFTGLPSGLVLVSDINRGLFVFDVSALQGVVNAIPGAWTRYP